MQLLDAAEFRAAPASPLLARDEIHLWQLLLDQALRPREVTAATYAFIGRLLMRYADLQTAPEIARTERGKPYAPALAGIDFNLSHAREHVLIAIARAQPLGVDVERIDRTIEVENLARRFYSREEADALAALPEPLRRAAFLRVWTCKEAVLKALGAGLTFGLDRVGFAIDGAGFPTGLATLAPEAGVADEWHVVRLDPAPDMLGALAWRGPPRKVRAFVAGSDA